MVCPKLRLTKGRFLFFPLFQGRNQLIINTEVGGEYAQDLH
jgi:hypothetical protein